ncbi:hypothetical protein LEMLEM_LOCUS12244, partial [Lemmus lemmus]
PVSAGRRIVSVFGACRGSRARRAAVPGPRHTSPEPWRTLPAGRGLRPGAPASGPERNPPFAPQSHPPLGEEPPEFPRQNLKERLSEKTMWVARPLQDGELIRKFSAVFKNPEVLKTPVENHTL